MNYRQWRGKTEIGRSEFVGIGKEKKRVREEQSVGDGEEYDYEPDSRASSEPDNFYRKR